MSDPRVIRHLLIGLLVGAVWSSLPASALEPVVLTEGRSQYPLGAYLELLEDPSGSLSIDDVRRPEHAARFAAHEEAEPNLGLTDSAWWVRFSVRDDSRRPRDWLLELAWPMTDLVELYVPGPDGFDVDRAGDTLPLEGRAVRSRQPTFRVALPSGVPTTLYLRISSENSQVVALTLWSDAAFARSEASTSLALGILYGALSLMLASALLLYATTRDPIYVSYAAMVLGFGLWDACNDGLLYAYVWPAPWWSNRVLHLAGALAVLGQFDFARRFVEIARHLPRLHRALRLALVGLMALALLPFLGLTHVFVWVAVVSGIGVSLAILWAAGVAALRGHRPARYFLLAWSFGMLAAMPQGFRGLGMAPTHFATEHGVQIGVVVTFLALWLGLVDRLRSANDEIRALNVGLEERVRDRTRELEAATRELAHANDARRRFLATASHDLRQPLHALSLLVGALAGRAREPGARELVDRIEESTESMGEMFDSLLDLSKLDAGMLEPKRSGFALQPLFERLVADLEHAAARKGLVLRAERTAAAVESDPLLLRRILQNLLVNAIRYTDAGEVVLRARGFDAGVTIEVEDTGRGIPEAKRERIFDEYERLGADDGDSEGLGLGLSIVRRLATLLEHPLDVESTPGAGSIFRLRVPSGSAAAARSDTAAGDLGGALVLAVDDDESVLDGVRELLDTWGCRVLTAASSAEVRAALDAEGRAPELILSDYQLDGETGFDVIDAIRVRAGREIPAVLLTGDSSSAPADEAARRGLLLLRKPVAPMRLRAALTHALLGRAG